MAAYRLEWGRLQVTATSRIHDVHAETHAATGSGKVRIEGARRQVEALEIDIDLATLRTGDPLKDLEIRRRLGDGKGGRARFVLSSAAEINEAPSALRGSLTFRGVARPLEVLAQIREEGAAFGGDATFEVRFTDFGLEPPKLLFLKVSDVVKVRVDLRGVEEGLSA